MRGGSGVSGCKSGKSGGWLIGCGGGCEVGVVGGGGDRIL